MPHGILIWVDPVNGDGATQLAQALQLYLCHCKARLRLWFELFGTQHSIYWNVDAD
jgi:hypothetical protein